MKIYIATFSAAFNFGAKMQAFALCDFFGALGHDTRIFNFHNYAADYTLNKKKENYEWFRRCINYECFSQKHLHFTNPTYSESDIAEIANDADLIVLGSDQVWGYPINPTVKLARYLGSFVKNKTTIIASYAASFGDTNIDTQGFRVFYKKHLRNLDYIAIREPKFKSLIEELSGVPCEITVDPTMLIDKTRYQIFVKEKPYKSDYIYVHWEYGYNDSLHNYACKLSEMTGLPIYAAHNFAGDYKPKKISYPNQIADAFECSPDELVNIIAHSRYVVTSSFHVMVFAILFQKDFYINNGSVRVSSLLELFGLSDRILLRNETPLEKVVPISPDQWLKCNEAVLRLRIDSQKYLMNVTSGKKRSRVGDYFTSQDEFTCYGCHACEKSCAFGAITMNRDNEGFVFPVVDEGKCTDCGVCRKVCPYNNKSYYSGSPDIYSAINKNKKQLEQSSSGGVFPALASAVLAQGGYVIGVRQTDGFGAVYDIADNAKDCFKFRYSKYIEPQDGDIFDKTLTALKTGKPVLFTGTPCKIAGLKNFLTQKGTSVANYDNLYLVDIICHGTNSPVALEQWLKEKENEQQSPLKHFQFRSPKAPSWAQANEYVYENGKEEIVSKADDIFMKLYLTNSMLKKSCYVCEFTAHNALADMTIGDFWGCEKFGDFDTAKGVSFIKVNTDKGKAFFESIRGKFTLQTQKFWDIYASNTNSPHPIPIIRGELAQHLEQGRTISEFYERASAERMK